MGNHYSYPDSGNSSHRSRQIDCENASFDEPLPANYKVKFMCSYGGKVQPSPHDNQLSYISGNAKILAVDRHVRFHQFLPKLSSLVENDDASSLCFKFQLQLDPDIVSTSKGPDVADVGSMESPSLFPLDRCKIIHLVRHAQGTHNAEKNHDKYKLPAFFDPQLTPRGWDQVHDLRKRVHECGLDKKIDLVIVSPLLRTMQTAVGVFGGENCVDGVDAPPLMVARSGNSAHPAISSLNCPPFLAVETCRERLGVNKCDQRRSISEYRTLFPAIDFSLIESDEDIMWTANKTREADAKVAARGMEFLNWLRKRKEKEIAIVSHSAFLSVALKKFADACHPPVEEEITKDFANCELRSLVLVDRSMNGSDLSATNFPGKIPRGPDLPSDVA